MSTSGTITYNQTRDQISTDALQLLGIVGSGETATTNDLNFCSNMMNKMIKSWESMGIHLWKESDAIVALTLNQVQYNLSSSSSDHIGDSAVETTLTATALAHATTLTVSSTNGMNVNDNIGIVLDAGTIFWTTVQSVTNSTTVVINSGIPTQASSGNTVIDYTTQITRPLNIINVRYHYNSGIERLLKKAGRTEYMMLPVKTMAAPCTLYYYNPLLSSGQLYIWPAPTTVNDTLHISYLQSIQDMNSGTDNPDFPQEWLAPLTYNLAVQIAPAFGISLSKTMPEIAELARMYLDELSKWDAEEGSVHVVPNYRYDQ